jgi:uncharacterized protein (DUF2252 family)
MNIVRRIITANRNRDAERLAMKYSAMRTNAFVFLRGTCHLFYDRLPKGGIFKSAPQVWCCGDLHLENFGSYKGDNRLAYFDINDFDEAALAPATWELARLVTSILVSAQSYGVSNANAQVLAKQFLDAYAAALVLGNARWVERENASGMVKELLEQLRMRTRVDFLNARTRHEGKLRHFHPDGKRTLPVSEEHRQRVMAFMRTFAQTQHHPAFFNVVDVARRIAGTGSLGVDRYAILVEGKGSPNQNYLLDLKQALPSSIATHWTVTQPKWDSEAERVVAVQRRMQAVSMAFLHPVVMGERSYVLRALQPLEDRLPLAKYHEHIDYMVGVVRVMGECAAWAQLRSSGRQGSAIADQLIDFAAAKKWRAKLLNSAYELANQVQADWQTYCEAYDDGAFKSGPERSG